MRPIGPRAALDLGAHPRLSQTAPSPQPMKAEIGFGPLRTLMLTSGVESNFCSRVPLHFFSMLKRIEALRPRMIALSDVQLREKLGDLKARRMRGAGLEALLPEVFAVVREASRRTLGMEHRPVQLLAGMALVDRSVAQLRTGEGKTLVAALAAILFALEGKGCHVATTNGYLAARDAHLLEPLYSVLGISVGVAQSMGQTVDEKRAAYAADVTYAHADTLGFDWLDDQLVYRPELRMQRGLAYAIVDEADDVLLDTAEQPMVLCGAPETDEALETRRRLVALAQEVAAEIDPQRDLRLFFRQERWHPALTDMGAAHLESIIARRLSIDGSAVWSEANGPLIHQVMKALEATHSVRAGEHYIGDAEKVVLVSSTTGHSQPGSRLRHGLMDAVHFKEGREIERELLPVGQVTYQSFFNMYGRLSGMTGTARGGRQELRDNYGLKVIEIPPHNPSQRTDLPDRFFPHPAPRLLAALADALDRHARGQPVLISTSSVTESKAVGERLQDPRVLLADVAVSSERLFEEASSRLDLRSDSAGPSSPTDRHARVLARLREDPRGALAFAAFLESKGLPAIRLLEAERGIAHRVLNAENEAEEASIIARAGERSAITIATQMAGRGTDIALGEGVEALGGLHVICIGHKANRRKDEQAIGRAGRHGQKGSSQFFVAPTDPVFSFLPARIMRELCKELGAEEIRQPTGSTLRRFQRAIDQAQSRSEDALAYARTINTCYDRFIQLKRRRVIADREEVLHSNALPELVHQWLKADLAKAIERSESGQAVRAFFRDLDRDLVVPEGAGPAELEALLATTLERQIARTKKNRGEDEAAFRQYIRDMFLFTIDCAWIDFLDAKDDLRRQAVNQMMADKNPFLEFGAAASRAFDRTGDEVMRAIISRYKFHLESSARG